MNSVFFVLEILGDVAFALSGALTAMKRKMDIFGACVLGMTTAIGGGVIRDLLLGITPPTAFTTPIHALIGIGVSAFSYVPFVQKFLSGENHKKYDACLFFADTLGLAVFTVIGVNTGFELLHNPNLFTTVFLGVITGVGGGVLRDVMSLNLPKIFVKYFYACASILGALVCYLTYGIFGAILSSLLGLFIIIILRVLAAVLHWKLPKPKYEFTSDK